jgi:uncharacterized membrane protein
MFNFLKSKTIWAAVFVAILPYADTVVGITTGINPLAGAIIGGIFAILRVVTTKPLSEK